MSLELEMELQPVTTHTHTLYFVFMELQTNICIIKTSEFNNDRYVYSRLSLQRMTLERKGGLLLKINKPLYRLV